MTGPDPGGSGMASTTPGPANVDGAEHRPDYRDSPDYREAVAMDREDQMEAYHAQQAANAWEAGYDAADYDEPSLEDRYAADAAASAWAVDVDDPADELVRDERVDDDAALDLVTDAEVDLGYDSSGYDVAADLDQDRDSGQDAGFGQAM